MKFVHSGQPNPNTDAILSTLNFACETDDVGVSVNASLTEPRLSIDEDHVTLHGWAPIFVYVSRLAHTLPSDAFNMALVVEMLRFVDNVSLGVLEEQLCGQTWLCSCFDESTAADFLCISRLRHLDVSATEFPRLREYMDQNPAHATSMYHTDTSVNWGCVVS